MKTLIIYDMNGVVLQQAHTSYTIPSGVPYIEVEIPVGKYIKSVNVETKEPIYSDFPKSEVDILKDKISILTEKNNKLEKEQADLLFMLMENNVL